MLLLPLHFDEDKSQFNYSQVVVRIAALKKRMRISFDGIHIAQRVILLDGAVPCQLYKNRHSKSVFVPIYHLSNKIYFLFSQVFVSNIQK